MGNSGNFKKKKKGKIRSGILQILETVKYNPKLHIGKKKKKRPQTKPNQTSAIKPPREEERGTFPRARSPGGYFPPFQPPPPPTPPPRPGLPWGCAQDPLPAIFRTAVVSCEIGVVFPLFNSFLPPTFYSNRFPSCSRNGPLHRALN